MFKKLKNVFDEKGKIMLPIIIFTFSYDFHNKYFYKFFLTNILKILINKILLIIRTNKIFLFVSYI